MRHFLAALLVAAVCGATPAFAVEREDFRLLTTRHLYNICGAGKADPLREQSIYFCFGFFTGAARYHRAIGAGRKGSKYRIVCPPGKRPIGRGEAVRVFLAYMQANPKYLNEPPIDGLIRALAAKWPCKAPK